MPGACCCLLHAITTLAVSTTVRPTTFSWRDSASIRETCTVYVLPGTKPRKVVSCDPPPTVTWLGTPSRAYDTRKEEDGEEEAAAAADQLILTLVLSLSTHSVWSCCRGAKRIRPRGSLFLIHPCHPFLSRDEPTSAVASPAATGACCSVVLKRRVWAAWARPWFKKGARTTRAPRLRPPRPRAARGVLVLTHDCRAAPGTKARVVNAVYKKEGEGMHDE